MLAAQLADQGAKLNHLRRIQPHGGLVQNQHFRVAQQRGGQAYPLPVPFGQVADQAMGHIDGCHPVHGFAHLFGPLGAGHPAQLGHKAQVFLHRHFRIEGRLLGQVSQLTPCLHGLFQNIMPADDHTALAGGEIPGQHVHGGGFAGAVGPQQTADLPGGNRKGQILYRNLRPVAAGQMLHLDQCATLLCKRKGHPFRDDLIRSAGSIRRRCVDSANSR